MQTIGLIGLGKVGGRHRDIAARYEVLASRSKASIATT
jgi:hypothetical protein